ncbi:TPA: N-6 DNA methylase [Pseudomonas aeruginosa]
MTPATQHIGSMVKTINAIGYHQPRDVFLDFCQMGAIAISNAADLLHRESREQEYLRLIRKYKPAHHGIFSTLLGELQLALEKAPCDILGQLFMELGASTAQTGQFFTPVSITDVLGGLALGNGNQVREMIEDKGFFTVSEPASGSGAMIISLALQLQELGINYQQHMHATLVDIDSRAVHMAYLQLSLLHIPAIVVHGNSLTLQEHSRWRTPAHVMGLFETKLRRGFSLDSAKGRSYLGCDQAKAAIPRLEALMAG